MLLKQLKSELATLDRKIQLELAPKHESTQEQEKTSDNIADGISSGQTHGVDNGNGITVCTANGNPKVQIRNEEETPIRKKGLSV